MKFKVGIRTMEIVEVEAMSAQQALDTVAAQLPKFHTSPDEVFIVEEGQIIEIQNEKEIDENDKENHDC